MFDASQRRPKARASLRRPGLPSTPPAKLVPLSFLDSTIVNVALRSLLSVAATVPFVFLGARTSYVLLCLIMVARGAGIGLSLMPAMTAAYRALPAGKIADATPQLNILQRTGGSIGTAVFTVILTRQLTHAASPAATASAFGATFAWVLAITAVAAAPALLLARAERHARNWPPVTSPSAKEEPDEVH